MLVASSAVTFGGFAILGWLINQTWFYSGLGVSVPSPAAALLLFLLISPVFTVFLQPILAYFQRRHEFEADDYAAGQTRPSFLISALVKLYRDNASTLTPDPLYSAFHYSHPPAAIRIAHLSAKP
jgi:STE24 endopeptidase